MTAPTPRPLRLAVSPRSADILRRCYRREDPVAVLERALLMLAQADGHLDTAGHITTERARKAGR
ncbi:hypothetical protein ACFCX0_03680 [Streptomyces sp. NPDC056352]|uniref:hypothetical protein n=1 Tax=Streptomyces sp. NPDC056352 TaxID=3345791 RepID=UPI0035E320D3